VCGLEMDQRRGNVDEHRAELHVHLRRLLDVVQVLVRDLRDWNVLDVDLLLADQIQQQVERSIVLFQVEIKRRSHYLSEYRYWTPGC
jgi:hypothetical protein